MSDAAKATRGAPAPDHYRRLERMYHAAPVNRFYEPTLEVSEGQAVLTMAARPEHFHAAGAVHGSVCFKALDDAAYFAVASLVRDRFVLTASFTIYLLRPVIEGILRAEGRVASASKNLWVAESVLTDDRGREVARGSGTFVRGRMRLDEVESFR